MTDEVNGQDVANAETKQRTAAADYQQKMAQVNVAARTISGVVMRGMMVSAPGIQPLDLAAATAFQMGRVLAEAFEGDLVTIIGVRKQIKDAFEKGINSLPPGKPQAQPHFDPKRLNG